MSYSSRTYRHRNPKPQENEQQSSGPSFFHTAGKGAVQLKKDDGFFQTKLSVNQPGDEYEREADAVAGSVVNGAGAEPKKKEVGGIQRMPGNAGGATGAGASSGVTNRVEQSAGTGRHLSGKLLADMNHQFGADLSDITIHTDSEAHQLNKELGAQAFTHGKDIYFNAGKYNPETAQGRFLLAHELTHVVQQAGEDDQIHRMAACPGYLGPQDPVPPGWKPYYGNPAIFHCGFRGILEDRKPTPDDPMNECFYDQLGMLVDKNHAYSGCGGTPDYYDSEDDTWNHIFNDPGGIWNAGWGAFWESQRYNEDQEAKRQAECYANCANEEDSWSQGMCYESCGPYASPHF